MVYVEEFEVAAQVVKFYKALYQELEGWRPFVEGLEFDCIGDKERVWLERKFGRGKFLGCKRLGRGQSSRSRWFYYDFLSLLLESSGERCLSDF